MHLYSYNYLLKPMSTNELDTLIDYFRAFNCGRTDLLKQIAAPDFSIQTQSIGVLNLQEAIEYAPFYNPNLQYKVKEFCQIDATTYSVKAALQLLFLPNNICRDIPALGTFEFNNGLIRKVKFQIDYNQEEAKAIQNIIDNVQNMENQNK